MKVALNTTEQHSEMLSTFETAFLRSHALGNGDQYFMDLTQRRSWTSQHLRQQNTSEQIEQIQLIIEGAYGERKTTD